MCSMKTRTIGEMLRDERQGRRFRLEDLANRTRIRIENIEALEANEFEKLPSATFVKGYIKTYAELFGFDHKPLLALLRRDYKESARGTLVPREFITPVLRQRITFNSLTLFVIALVGVLLGLAFLHTGETVLRMAQTELFLYGENKMALCMEALQAALPMRLYGPIRKILESNTEYEVVSVPEAIALLESHQNHWTRWLQLVLHAEASKRNLAIEPMEQQTKTSGGTQHIDRVFLLRQTEMFESIRDNRLLDIAELMDEIEVDAGEFVFRKGDEGDSLYVITSGEISILDGGHELVRFSKGDFFGDLSLLDPAPRSADAKSVGKTTLLRLDEAAIYELMTGHIEVVKGILSALCKRIRNQNKLYVEAKNAM